MLIISQLQKKKTYIELNGKREEAVGKKKKEGKFIAFVQTTSRVSGKTLKEVL